MSGSTVTKCFLWSANADYLRGLCTMKLDAESSNTARVCHVCIKPVKPAISGTSGSSGGGGSAGGGSAGASVGGGP